MKGTSKQHNVTPTQSHLSLTDICQRTLRLANLPLAPCALHRWEQVHTEWNTTPTCRALQTLWTGFDLPAAPSSNSGLARGHRWFGEALLWKPAQLMHDNAKPCVAEVCQWQLLHDEGIDANGWSVPQILVQHFILIWFIMSRSIRRQCHVAQQAVLELLTDTWIQLWEEMCQETIGHLIRSLSRPHTHYWTLFWLFLWKFHWRWINLYSECPFLFSELESESVLFAKHQTRNYIPVGFISGYFVQACIKGWREP